MDTHEILHETFWNQPLAKRDSVKSPYQTCELQFQTMTNNIFKRKYKNNEQTKKKQKKQQKKNKKKQKKSNLIKFDQMYGFDQI